MEAKRKTQYFSETLTERNGWCNRSAVRTERRQLLSFPFSCVKGNRRDGARWRTHRLNEGGTTKVLRPLADRERRTFFVGSMLIGLKSVQRCEKSGMIINAREPGRENAYEDLFGGQHVGVCQSFKNR